MREDNLCACGICMMLKNRDEQEWDDEVKWGEEDSDDSGYDSF